MKRSARLIRVGHRGLVCAWFLFVPLTASANINLELRGMPTNICGGGLISLGLYAVSDNAGNQSMGGAEVLLVWDEARLKLVGKTDNGPYPWLSSFFPNDSLGDGLNEPFTGPNPFVPENDGDAIYAVFSQFSPNPPAEATPAGLLITTLEFQAVGHGLGELEVPASYAAVSETRITDGVLPGLIVTGTLPTVSVNVACQAPVTATAIGSRWISASTGVGPGGCPTQVGLRVIGDAGSADTACISLHAQASGILGEVPFTQPPLSWGTVKLRSTGILPGSTYSIHSACGNATPNGLGPGVTVTTWNFGDVDNNGLVDVDDIVTILLGFTGEIPPAGIESIDLMPCTPDSLIDVDDVLGILEAFQGTPFTAICPTPCP